MILAIALLTAVVGIAWLVFSRYTGTSAVSVALSGPPPPGPPRLPTEFRLCPVCGSILRMRQLEYGWTAVCPACDYRLLLED